MNQLWSAGGRRVGIGSRKVRPVMLVDLDSLGSPQDHAPGGALVIPYPVPSGLLDRIVETADQGGADGRIVFAEACDLAPDVRIGWQVGVLVRLLPHGFGAVDGVEPEVLRRVHEVLRRIEEAR